MKLRNDRLLQILIVSNNMRATIENEYKTKDYYIGVCILAYGAQLLRLEKISEKIVVFVFAISSTNADEIIKKHWDRELVLPTRDIIDAIHELKTRIYSGT